MALWDCMVTAFNTAEIYETESGSARVFMDDEFFREFRDPAAAENWLWKHGFRY